MHIIHFHFVMILLLLSLSEHYNLPYIFKMKINQQSLLLFYVNALLYLSIYLLFHLLSVINANVVRVDSRLFHPTFHPPVR
jgi:hypothetical protein